MIKHEYKNGNSTITIESAENIQDAEANKFGEGVYTRFYVNGKPVNNYMAMVRFIAEETKRTGQRFIPPSGAELKRLQAETIEKQKREMQKVYDNLKAKYKEMNVPESAIKLMDEAINKIDLAGVRVAE